MSTFTTKSGAQIYQKDQDSGLLLGLRRGDSTMSEAKTCGDIDLHRRRFVATAAMTRLSRASTTDHTGVTD